MMRYFPDRVGIGLRLALSLIPLMAVCLTASAQTPEPVPDMKKVGQLTTKQTEGPPSQLKPVDPLFDPSKTTKAVPTSTYRKPFRFSAGIFSPNSSGLRNATNDLYTAFGISMDMPPFGPTKPFTQVMYIDGAYHRDNAQDTEATLVGEGIGFRSYPGVKPGFVIDRPRPFYGAGVGLYYLESDISGIKQETTRFGGKAMAGFDFRDDWSLEVNYTLVGKLHGTDFGGPRVVFAYRL